jgi:hypothetical protein
VVVWCPVAKAQQLLVQVPPPAHLIKDAPASIDQAPAKLQPYLMGMWQDVWVDPNAWAIGPLPVSHFVVKSAARRMKLLLDLQAADPDFSVAYGQRPRLWPCPDGSGGLLALEQRWQSLFSNKCVLLRVRNRSARRRAPEPAPAALPAAAVTGRVHPLERAAVAASALRGQPVDAFADASDALMRGVMGLPLQQPPWREAYASLRLPRLDRITIFLGGGCCMVRCGAVRRLCCGARWARCAAQPRPALEMRRWWGHRWSPCRTSLWCHVVQPAVAWLRGVWAMLVAGRVPPLDVRVLLAGDHTVWDPGGGEAGAELWTHLRLLFCRAVWCLRCCKVAHGQVFSASAVVAPAPTLPSWCVIHKRFDMSQAEFIKRWCLNIVLAEVSSDADGSAVVRVHVPPLAAVTVPVAL